MNNTELLDFLAFSYFGYTYSEIADMETKSIAQICAKRAYRDLARTLTYKKPEIGMGNNKKTMRDVEDKKSNFINSSCDMIADLIKNKLVSSPDQNSFDSNHVDICESIIEEKGYTIKGKSFSSIREEVLDSALHYGQAQKWLNMTMKYMLLLGVEEVVAMKKYLHVPIDSYILKAAASDDSKYSLVSNTDKQNCDRKMLNKYKNISWSTINKDQYTCPTNTDITISETNNGLQDVIRRQILARKWVDVKCPIDWEAKAWIEQAKKERWQKQD